MAARSYAAPARRAACFLLALLMAAGVAAGARFKSGTVTIHAQGQELRYQVEVADTGQLRGIGLMYRASLPENHGMLLLNERPQQARIWMKNTFVPLDIIYIDDSGRIVNIFENAVPESTTIMPSDGAVKAVLEVNAGQVRARGIAVGDRVDYRVR